jgi:hypothetical protein
VPTNVSSSVAKACPDLDCLPGIDLANFNPQGLGEAVLGLSTAGVSSLFSLLPISLLAKLNQWMLGAAQPNDPRSECVVPVLSGGDIKAFEGGTVTNDFLDAVIRVAKLKKKVANLTEVAKGVQNVFKSCKGLPIENNSVLLQRQFIWGAVGTMQVDIMLDVLTSEFKWFQGKAGAALQKLMKWRPSLAVCAAVNPCKGDYLFALEGFDFTVQLPMKPPLFLLIEKAGITSIGWSSTRALVTKVTAWDPFELFVPFSAVATISKQTYTMEALFQLQMKASIGVTVTAAMSSYISNAKVLKAMPDLTIKITTDLTGRVAWGTGATGYQVLVQGEALPPTVTLADVLTLPVLTPGSLATQQLTLYVHQRSGDQGFTTVWLQYQAIIRFADILKRVQPFGKSLASILDGDDKAPIQLNGGFEVCDRQAACMSANEFT